MVKNLAIERKKLEEEFEIKIKSEMSTVQERCFELEKEIRKLKSENQYYHDKLKEKDATLTQFSHKISSCQKEIESLRKQLFIAEEAHEKAELRVKEVLDNSGDDLSHSGGSHTASDVITAQHNVTASYRENFLATSTPLIGRSGKILR